MSGGGETVRLRVVVRGDVVGSVALLTNALACSTTNGPFMKNNACCGTVVRNRA